MYPVCATCGAATGESRSGRTVHIEGIPKGYPEHDVEATVTAQEWQTQSFAATDLKGAAQDMLAHHITGHPEADCAFAQNLRRALS